MAIFSKLYYHIIFVTKKRQWFLTRDLEPIVHRAIKDYLFEVGAYSVIINGVHDHVHILVKFPARFDIYKPIGQCKRRSAKIARQYNKDFMWQRDSAIFTVSHYEYPTIRGYIRKQKRHHATKRARRMLEFEGAQDEEHY